MSTIKQAREEAMSDASRALLERAIDNIHISKLPTALLEHDFGERVDVDCPYYYHEWEGSRKIVVILNLSTNYRTLKDVVALKKELGKYCGVTFEKVSHSYEQSFTHEGILVDDVPEGYVVEIEIRSAPKPATCVLTKSYETRRVEVYKATCSDTGEEM